ncbi:MAG: hypothetical protein U0641_14685 [Anaerolineae bacterium]
MDTRELTAVKIIEPLLFEISEPGRETGRVPVELDVPEAELPADLVRAELPLPEVSEIQVVRHFTRLSQLNFSVDTNFYPLGSCTMKYNPKVNDWVAALPGFTNIHPYQPVETVQGALEMMYELQPDHLEDGSLRLRDAQPCSSARLTRRYHRLHRQRRHQAPAFVIPPRNANHGSYGRLPSPTCPPTRAATLGPGGLARRDGRHRGPA